MLRGIHENFEQQAAPAFFARGASPLARLTFFTALSVALIATDSRLNYLANIRHNLMAAVYPLQIIANVPTNICKFTTEYFSTHHHLLDENAHLKEQLLLQASELQQLNLLKLDNENLRHLLSAQKTISQSSTLAEILHVGRDSFTQKVIVNRGLNDEIKTGAAAVDAKGVIGQVTRTYANSSEVTLITDKSLSIPVQIERNGMRAIAFGRGRENTLELPFPPGNVDIKPGDKLVTSGIDGIYPAGLAVATVSEMHTSPDSPFASIICTPGADIENYRHILLISLAKPAADAGVKASINKNNLYQSAADQAKEVENPSANITGNMNSGPANAQQ